MDGNRRWAKTRGFGVTKYHGQGAKNVERVLDLCLEAKVDVASFWGLAYRNVLERSKLELTAIFGILENNLPEMTSKMKTKGVAFDWCGDASILPKSTVKALETGKKLTAGGEKMKCILAIGYGGRHEIVQAVQKLLREGADPASVTEESFAAALDTGRFPTPDLVVRTGGHDRHSGYFLYASEYCEYHFSDTLWPDFGAADFSAAMEGYRKAQRNFGK